MDFEITRVDCNSKAKATQLIVSDSVLVKILAHDVKHNLSDKSADKVYVFRGHPNFEIPVYKEAMKALHRNHLLHIGIKMQKNRLFH